MTTSPPSPPHSPNTGPRVPTTSDEQPSPQTAPPPLPTTHLPLTTPLRISAPRDSDRKEVVPFNTDSLVKSFESIEIQQSPKTAPPPRPTPHPSPAAPLRISIPSHSVVRAAVAFNIDDPIQRSPKSNLPTSQFDPFEPLGSEEFSAPYLSEIIQSLKELKVSNDEYFSKFDEPQNLEGVFQVVPQTLKQVADGCHKLLLRIQEVEYRGFKCTVTPSRCYSNQSFSKTLDRRILDISGNYIRFSIQAEATSMLAYLAQVIRDLCYLPDEQYTFRELFYTNKSLFKDTDNLVKCVNHLCCLLQCTRSSLPLEGSDTGLVLGRIQFFYDNDQSLVNCMKKGGAPIPDDVGQISEIYYDAMFILVVESDSILRRLQGSHFHEKYPVIMITGKGYPGVETLRFVNFVRKLTRLPILALVDGDADGFQIFEQYRFGSKELCFDSGNLAIPGIKWLGVRSSDIDKYKIPLNSLKKLDDRELEMVDTLLQSDIVSDREEWKKELNTLKEKGVCAELESLNSLGLSYFTGEFLPNKLKEKDWI